MLHGAAAVPPVGAASSLSLKTYEAWVSAHLGAAWKGLNGCRMLLLLHVVLLCPPPTQGVGAGLLDTPAVHRLAWLPASQLPARYTLQ